MRHISLPVALVVALTMALPIGAGQASAQSAPTSSPDVARIQKQLRLSASREAGGPRLSYRVEVFGKAPRFDLFARTENLRTGPVPYGAPTRAQMRDAMTPQAFRPPVADVGAFVRWMAGVSGGGTR